MRDNMNPSFDDSAKWAISAKEEEVQAELVKSGIDPDKSQQRLSDIAEERISAHKSKE